MPRRPAADQPALIRRSTAAGADEVAYRELVHLVDQGRGYVALKAARRVNESRDALILQAVAQARAAGRTWAEIGEALGVTKQAAHLRFARDLPDGNKKVVKGA